MYPRCEFCGQVLSQYEESTGVCDICWADKLIDDEEEYPRESDDEPL